MNKNNLDLLKEHVFTKAYTAFGVNVYKDINDTYYVRHPLLGFCPLRQTIDNRIKEDRVEETAEWELVQPKAIQSAKLADHTKTKEGEEG